MSALESVLQHLDQNLDTSVDHLFDLLRIKSISTDPAFKADCRQAAEWLVEDLISIGFDANVRDTPGHPMVVAHHEGATADAPHVLFYGHYDVQPVDPLNLWENDRSGNPRPESRDGRHALRLNKHSRSFRQRVVQRGALRRAAPSREAASR